MNRELAEFAEEVRRACIDIFGAAGAGQTKEAGQLALSLCTRAAVVKQGELMKAEKAEPDRFDLALLSVNLNAAAPERGED